MRTEKGTHNFGTKVPKLKHGLGIAREILRQWGGDRRSEAYQRNKSSIDIPAGKNWTTYCQGIAIFGIFAVFGIVQALADSSFVRILTKLLIDTRGLKSRCLKLLMSSIAPLVLGSFPLAVGQWLPAKLEWPPGISYTKYSWSHRVRSLLGANIFIKDNGEEGCLELLTGEQQKKVALALHQAGKSQEEAAAAAAVRPNNTKLGER